MKNKMLFIFTIITFFAFASYTNALTVVDCGNVTEIPAKVPNITSLIVTIVEIAVPVVLVIFGMMDLFKGVTASKEEEMKKGTKMLVKRIVLAFIIFFIFVITRLVVSVVADDTDKQNIVSCMNCFLNGQCVNQRQKTVD